MYVKRDWATLWDSAMEKLDGDYFGAPWVLYSNELGDTTGGEYAGRMKVTDGEGSNPKFFS